MKSSSGSARRRNELRHYLLELLDACPLEQCNPEDCPLSSLRQIDSKDRQAWLKALAEDDLEYLAAYHRVCLGIKIEAGSPAAN